LALANYFFISTNPEIVEKFVLAPDKGFAVSPLALPIPACLDAARSETGSGFDLYKDCRVTQRTEYPVQGLSILHVTVRTSSLPFWIKPKGRGGGC